MNSALRQAARVTQRRFQSSNSNVSTTFLTKHKEFSMKKAWFSDPSTFPLLLIMGVAGSLVVGVGSSCLLYSPDVQISPSKRGAVMRDWDF